MNKYLFLLLVVSNFIWGCKEYAPVIICDITNLAKNDIDYHNRSFVIKNTGNADLIIEDYEKGCDCTSFDLKKTYISTH